MFIITCYRPSPQRVIIFHPCSVAALYNIPHTLDRFQYIYVNNCMHINVKWTLITKTTEVAETLFVIKLLGRISGDVLYIRS